MHENDKDTSSIFKSVSMDVEDGGMYDLFLSFACSA